MSKDIYIGVDGKARRVTDIYAGAGGVARKARAAYVGDGDGDGKARCFFGKPWPPGIITPDNMTGNSAPAPYRAKSRSNWSATYDSWCAFTAASRFVAGAGGTIPSGSDIPTNGEWWTEADLGGVRGADRGRLKSPDENYAGRVFPGEFQILGSNDADAWNDDLTSGKWTVLGSVTGYTWPSANYTWAAEFTLDNPGYYRYYRIKVTRGVKIAPAGDSHITIGQIELSAT
jgi:hypothetical protein